MNLAYRIRQYAYKPLSLVIRIPGIGYTGSENEA